jgi:hypothetical protein
MDDVEKLATRVQALEENTAPVVETYNDMEGTLRVLQTLGRIARPVGYIAAAIASILGMWVAIKGGVL